MKITSFLLNFALLISMPAQAEPTDSISSHQNQSVGKALIKERVRKGISDQEPWVGLVGDSGITGAASSSDIQPNWLNLLSLVSSFALESKMTVQIAHASRVPHAGQFGLYGDLEPLVRVVYSMEEFEAARSKGELTKINLEAKASLRLDIPEYSFGYLTARAMGVPANRVVLVAQDGKTVSTIFRQMKRFGEVSDTLPSHIFVSYSANDICGDELNMPLADFETGFRHTLRQQLDLVTQNLKPHPTLGTRVIVMAPLDVVQLLTNRDLFNQEIRLEGNQNATCGDIRLNADSQSSLQKEMKKTLKGMCRSILSIHPSDKSQIARLSLVQDRQISIWKSVLREYQIDGWTFEFNDRTRRPIFESGDLANDCFHPGPGAHSKIALELLKSLHI